MALGLCLGKFQRDMDENTVPEALLMTRCMCSECMEPHPDSQGTQCFDGHMMGRSEFGDSEMLHLRIIIVWSVEV